MSTNEQEKHPTLEELLGALGNKSLKRSHNSVNISFALMIAYIDKIRAEESVEEIKFLLQTYRDMALAFYQQYESSLLTEIEKQQTIQDQVKFAIKQMGTEDEMKPAKALLLENSNVAAEKQAELIKNFPTLLQQALDKLKDEWQRLNILAVANRILVKDEELLKALEVVAKVAAFSVGIEAEKIVIVPGNAFALYFFSYIENFAVLTVPIYSVRAPWEWSIFWHELAGYKVRKLENTTTIDAIYKKLNVFHKDYKLRNAEEQKKILDVITRNHINHNDPLSKRKNQFSWDYLNAVFTEDELNLSDLGSFEHQFEQMLANLPKKDKFQTYENFKTQGWCVDWFKELFEDAWSVLAIGEKFLPFFENILNRHKGVDSRHPTLEVRMEVANQILSLMNAGYQKEDADQPKSQEKLVAEQILKFISLLLVSFYKFENNDTNLNVFQNSMTANLFDSIGQEIGLSIEKWSTKTLVANNRVRDAKEDAETLITKFADDSVTNFRAHLNYKAQSEGLQIRPIYEFLLSGKDYLELLELSFYDADFGTATVTDVFYKTDKVFIEAKLSSVPTDVINGNVKYVIGNSPPKHTTFDFWNVAAAPDFKIPS